MNEELIQQYFSEMVTTISVKSSWQKERQELYKGNHSASTLNIALPREFDHKLITRLGWAKTAIDTLQNDLQFDGFSNDTLGFTRLLNDFNGYSSIESAIKNSMIGACAFISVLPNENGEPFFTAFSGSEASGIFDSKDGLIAGLTINSYSESFGFKTIKDYLLFLKGFVIKIDASGEIKNVVEMPTQRMLLIPFIYEQDIANNPFGNSRINAPAINALESALRTLKLIEFGHDLRIAIRNILMADGSSPSDLSKNEQNPNMMSLLTIFNEGSGNLKLEQLVAPETEELQDMLGLLAGNFANAVGMSATAFGYQPSNGSFGDAALEENGKPYKNLVRKQREEYGKAIKELAISAMSLVTGQYDKDWEIIKAEFIENVSLNQFGAIADGIQKMALIAPSIDFSEFIERKVLGKTIREEALQVSLPNFRKAQNSAQLYASLSANSETVI